jgi:hypothetical protein
MEYIKKSNFISKSILVLNVLFILGNIDIFLIPAFTTLIKVPNEYKKIYSYHMFLIPMVRPLNAYTLAV